MTTISDTTPEAEAIQLELLRKMTGVQRLQLAARMSDAAARMSKQAIRRRHPEFSDDEVAIKFIELHYGRELAEGVSTKLASRSGA